MSKIQRAILIVFAVIIFVQAESGHVNVEKVIATTISAIFFYVAFSKKDPTENSK